MKLRVLSSWRSGGHDPQGRTILLHPGDYDIPGDIDPKLAEQAKREGIAEIIGANPEPAPPARRKGMPAAPENKMLLEEERDA